MGPYICFCKIQNHSIFEFFNFILNLKPSKKEALLRFKAKFVTQWRYFLRIHDLSLLIFRFASTKSLNKRIIYKRNKCEPPLHCQNCKICKDPAIMHRKSTRINHTFKKKHIRMVFSLLRIIIISSDYTKNQHIIHKPFHVTQAWPQ